MFSLLKTEQLVNAFVFGCFVVTRCLPFWLPNPFFFLKEKYIKDIFMSSNVTSPQPTRPIVSAGKNSSVVSYVGQLCVLCDAVLYLHTPRWAGFMSLCCIFVFSDVHAMVPSLLTNWVLL